MIHTTNHVLGEPDKESSIGNDLSDQVLEKVIKQFEKQKLVLPQKTKK